MCCWAQPSGKVGQTSLVYTSQVYLSSQAFARFTNVRYTRELAELDNQFVHLTNVAVQKEGCSAYNSIHGNKWPLQDLRLHLEATRGHASVAHLFDQIQALVVHTLKAVQPVSGSCAWPAWGC
jgi:tubulin polyglutamylase TTLL1